MAYLGRLQWCSNHGFFEHIVIENELLLFALLHLWSPLAFSVLKLLAPF